MTTTGSTASQSSTLILVSGAGHGAWCWQKLVPLLTAKGHKVLALDLPGTGNDEAALEHITLADDVNAVIAAANTVDGKILLLGHSSGGVIISQAAEMLGTAKVDKLLYLDAFLPQNGESVFAIAEKLGQRTQPSFVSTAPVSERFIFSNSNGLFKWNPALVEELLYHDCSPQDIALAKAHLGWQSIATLATPVQLTDAVYGKIEKYYIHCSQARDLDKHSFTADVHCTMVEQLASGHSPFFSMPEKLAEIVEGYF